VTDRETGKEVVLKSVEELDIGNRLREFQKEHIDVFGPHWNNHSLVSIQRQTLSRVLYYDNLYRKIVGIPGVICEFGVQWGATLAQLIALRGIHEPYNYSRHIFGFDTFEGFVNTSKEKDGTHLSDGDYRVYRDYEQRLDDVLSLHEAVCPIPQMKKFSLIKGDASVTTPKWVADNPHAIVAMAIFDMDIYKPTRDALEAIIPRLTKGSVLVFDELNCRSFPGETEALRDVLGTNKIRLQHFAHQPMAAWAVWGD